MFLFRCLLGERLPWLNPKSLLSNCKYMSTWTQLGKEKMSFVTRTKCEKQESVDETANHVRNYVDLKDPTGLWTALHCTARYRCVACLCRMSHWIDHHLWLFLSSSSQALEDFSAAKGVGSTKFNNATRANSAETFTHLPSDRSYSGTNSLRFDSQRWQRLSRTMNCLLWPRTN